MKPTAEEGSGDLARLLILIVSYNSEAVLEDTIASLKQGADGIGTRVLVVDNASLDGSSDLASRLGASVVQLPGNIGYSGGVNVALNELEDEEFLLILNPDVRCDTSTLQTLITLLESDDSIGAVGPRLLNRKGKPSSKPNGRRCVPRWVYRCHILLRWFPWNPATRYYFGKPRDEENPTDCDWLSGSFLVVRSDVFRKVGGFSEQYFLFFEDVSFGVRVRAHNRRNVYEPRAKVVHLGGKSSRHVWPWVRIKNRLLSSRRYYRTDYLLHKEVSARKPATGLE